MVLGQINVAWTNIILTVVYWQGGAWKTTLKVWSKSDEYQLKQCWHWVCGGRVIMLQSHFCVKPKLRYVRLSCGWEKWLWTIKGEIISWYSIPESFSCIKFRGTQSHSCSPSFSISTSPGIERGITTMMNITSTNMSGATWANWNTHSLMLVYFVNTVYYQGFKRMSQPSKV